MFRREVGSFKTVPNNSGSRFSILTGEVRLGQREELLKYAALPGEQVTVGVTQGMQTAIVEAGASALVNFNSFFRQALLDLLPGTDNVTTTITRLALDESGEPLTGDVVKLPPSQDVSADSESQQYHVRIGDAALTDSGVYTIEVCYQKDLPGEVCVNASATVFVLDGELK